VTAAPASILDGKPLIGWQTLLADLALILFMVTAAAMAASPPRQPKAPPPVAHREAPRAEAAAVWRAGGDAPPLGRWLRETAPDPRQQLTIAIHYPGTSGALANALARAAALADEAEAAGFPSRVLVEPGEAEVVATLSYDRIGPGVDRSTGTGLADHGR